MFTVRELAHLLRVHHDFSAIKILIKQAQLAIDESLKQEGTEPFENIFGGLYYDIFSSHEAIKKSLKDPALRNVHESVLWPWKRDLMTEWFLWEHYQRGIRDEIMALPDHGEW